MKCSVNGASFIFPMNDLDNQRILTIQNVLKEVEVCTPDSIEIAVRLLKLNNIQVPQSLIELNDLEQAWQQERDEQFAQKEQETKDMAMTELQNMLDANNSN